MEERIELYVQEQPRGCVECGSVCGVNDCRICSKGLRCHRCRAKREQRANRWNEGDIA